MRQRDLSEVSGRTPKRRSDVTTAIFNLTSEVMRLALHVKFNLAIADATKAERAALALRAAATEWVELGSTCEPTPAGEIKTSDEPLVSVTMLPAIDILHVNCRQLSPPEAPPTNLEEASGEPESEIAAGILKLHDRLGSFLKT